MAAYSYAFTTTKLGEVTSLRLSIDMRTLRPIFEVVEPNGHVETVPIGRHELAACLRFCLVAGAIERKDVAGDDEDVGRLAEKYASNAIEAMKARLADRDRELEIPLEMAEAIATAFYVGTFAGRGRGK